MPNYVAIGDNWYQVTATEQASFVAGTLTTATVISQKQQRSKKD